MDRTGIKELVTPSGDRITFRIADTFWSRFMGLMGKNKSAVSEGLLINPCNSIHMFFMKFSIDAIFLDKDFQVVKLIKNLKPGQLVNTVKGASQVLELPSGNLPGSITEGTRLQIDLLSE